MPPPPLALILLGPAARPAAPVADDLLGALVRYLESRAAVTSLLHSPSSIFTDAGAVDEDLPMLVLEGYDEAQPGRTMEDDQADVEVSAYAADLTAVRSILRAVAGVLDSPNFNDASTLPGPLRWRGGRTTAHMRGPLQMGRVPVLTRGGVHAYVGSVQYLFGMTPSP